MKKARSIIQPVAPVVSAPVVPPVVPQPVVPQPLNDSESLMLRHLMKLKNQAAINVAEFVGYVLTERNLQQAEWAVALNDYKTIFPSPKPTPVPAP